MRQRDEFPLDPEVVASLDAIDSTLKGQAVDPGQAEVAELALLLRQERPELRSGFAALLDQRMERRFAPEPARTGDAKRPRRRRWLWAPAAGLAASLVVAVAIVAAGGGGGTHVVSSSSAAASGTAAKAPSVPRAASSHAATASAQPKAQALTDTAGSFSNQSVNGSAVFAPAPVLQPPSNGRKIIQSAQLSLSTRPRQVDEVAQEVFNAVGQAHGIVKSSTVTANGGSGGYAQFQLSLPSSGLARTMAALSNLPHARVLSRTDSTQDVTNSFQADQRRLADDRALRASLLKQLATAITQGQIDSLHARIHDAESSISSDENTLRTLEHRISYSQVTVTINGGAVPVPLHHSTGFTIGKAAHDAGRVLTVAAGVALIALAALVPAGLLVALLWWIGARLRQRRRLQALDQI